MRKLIVTLVFSALTTSLFADKVPPAITSWAENYRAVGLGPKDKIKILNYTVDASRRRVLLEMNDAFGSQQWTQTRPQEIYSRVRTLLPSDLRTYSLTITTLGRPIEHLAPYSPLDTIARKPIQDYQGIPWVKNLSLPYSFSYGLAGRHLSVWASHGRYWDNDKSQWKWQRPFINDTREDILTPTIANELVIPMLESAGAIVWTPRERCASPNEYIVDNDVPESQHGTYVETQGHHKWTSAGEGFAPLKTLIQGINPFTLGTSRMAQGVLSSQGISTITWSPNIIRPERLAVYISYRTVPGSTNSAIYTVRHSGIETHFIINQQMGGGTWVYLGTFLFTPSDEENNRIVLTNCCNDGGVVSADAIRFGGGMGNIDRGGDISGETRYNEGARYSMQYAGMPDSIYAYSGGESDYKDDINCRSLATNRLCAGSIYNPDEQGLCVPIELTLGMHTDAGVNKEGVVGSLGIATTRTNDGKLATGCSRLLGRDLAEEVLTSVCNDMPRICGTWSRRQLWDKNYSETRVPMVPAAIIEMFSHENANDVRLATDSVARFHLARAIYKGVLRFIHNVHNMPAPIVQPLPVSNVRREGTLITWSPTHDPLESTAVPSCYLVQVAYGHRDFDNGTMVYSPSCTIDYPQDIPTRIRITAINAGGASLPVEI